MNIIEKLMAKWFVYKSREADYPYKVRLAVTEKIIIERKIMDILRNKSVKNLPLEGIFEPMEIMTDICHYRYFIVIRLKEEKVLCYEIYDSFLTDYVDVYYGDWKAEDSLDAIVKKMQTTNPFIGIQKFEVSCNKLSNYICEREIRKRSIIGYNVIANSIGKKIIDASFYTDA